ncbi:MAG: polysaccharide deacetylase family protein [archaeon]
MMRVISFTASVLSKGFSLLNQFHPINANYRKEFSEPLFFFTCDDIGKHDSIEDITELAKILDSNKVKATFFVVPKGINSTYAKKLSSLLRNHEIAQHGITHQKKELTKEPIAVITEKLKNERMLLESKFNRKIIGYRSPYFVWKRGMEKALKEAGFEYNSESYFFNPWSWKTREGLWCIPVESIGDIITHFEFNEKKTIDFMEHKLEHIKKQKKLFVFLFHIQSMKKGKTTLKKILSIAKKHGIKTEYSLGDFVAKLNKKV